LSFSIDRVARIPAEERRASHAGNVVQATPPIDSEDRLADALRVLDERHVSEPPVIHAGRLVGILSLSGIMRGLRLRERETPQHRAIV